MEKNGISIAIDLIDNDKNFAVNIVKTHKMTPSNYKELASFETLTFEKTVTKYECDICNSLCSEENTIHTNNKHQGCDKCMQQALSTIQPMPGWNPGPVYSLKTIVQQIREDN